MICINIIFICVTRVNGYLVPNYQLGSKRGSYQGFSGWVNRYLNMDPIGFGPGPSDQSGSKKRVNT